MRYEIQDIRDERLCKIVSSCVVIVIIVDTIVVDLVFFTVVFIMFLDDHEDLSIEIRLSLNQSSTTQFNSWRVVVCPPAHSNRPPTRSWISDLLSFDFDLTFLIQNSLYGNGISLHKSRIG